MCNEQIAFAILQSLSTLIFKNKCMIRFAEPPTKAEWGFFSDGKINNNINNTVSRKQGTVSKATVTQEEIKKNKQRRQYLILTDCFTHSTHDRHCPGHSDVKSLPETDREKFSPQKKHHMTQNLVVL